MQRDESTQGFGEGWGRALRCARACMVRLLLTGWVVIPTSALGVALAGAAESRLSFGVVESLQLHGQVVDDLGRAVPEVRVETWLSRDAGGLPWRAATGADGRFELHVPPPLESNERLRFVAAHLGDTDVAAALCAGQDGCIVTMRSPRALLEGRLGGLRRGERAQVSLWPSSDGGPGPVAPLVVWDVEVDDHDEVPFLIPVDRAWPVARAEVEASGYARWTDETLGDAWGRSELPSLHVVMEPTHPVALTGTAQVVAEEQVRLRGAVGAMDRDVSYAFVYGLSPEALVERIPSRPGDPAWVAEPVEVLLHVGCRDAVHFRLEVTNDRFLVAQGAVVEAPIPPCRPPDEEDATTRPDDVRLPPRDAVGPDAGPRDAGQDVAPEAPEEPVEVRIQGCSCATLPRGRDLPWTLWGWVGAALLVARSGRSRAEVRTPGRGRG